MKKLWMRLGDSGDYEDIDGPYEAGYDVGIYFEGKDAPDISWRTSLGVEVDPGFTGYNYISLFWGDDDAQPVSKANLTSSERAEFKRGLYEGADIRESPRTTTKPKSTKKKPKSKSRKTDTQLRMIR